MSRLIGQHYEGDVRVRWFDNKDGNISVEHHHDAQGVVDQVASAGVAPTIDGLGKPIAEIPVVKAMAWAAERGIPWEKLLYSPEYDAEFKRFIQEHSRLQYDAAKTVHAVQ